MEAGRIRLDFVLYSACSFHLCLNSSKRLDPGLYLLKSLFI
ncbi:hypothetical protein HOLDEFILI_03940 [Holdemania filiformis DSM 12042]|uniref:Uncharacterized protein n=1 Tax=Holdemania filiformis DSM 12042 TaxID=545696 RepID=B9YDL7_9FIRM|nr:hypothetical protein HOLDEFILI_03940 [Holdemania filiformis DSM 12042]